MKGNRCLYCYGPLSPGEIDYHGRCAKKFFGRLKRPEVPYSRDNISDLARNIIQSNTTVTGVQAKISLDIDRGGRNCPDKFTIVGLWGEYILKPQSEKYDSMPQLEDVTMKMAGEAGIVTAKHSLIRMKDGELAYITRRMDRGSEEVKYSMLDMCQLSNRLTEHKYRGSYAQLAEVIRKYSSASLLDVQRFWQIVLFSWITGNSDMHCKNFSLIDLKDGKGYVLSPAYDLLAVLLTGIEDSNELALTLSGPGVNDSAYIGGSGRKDCIDVMVESGINRRFAEIMIDKLISYRDKWFGLIDISFLRDDLKSRYKKLIDERIGRLAP